MSFVRNLPLPVLLQLIQTYEDVTTGENVRRLERLLRKALELENQGADIFKGYSLSITATTDPQIFNLQQFFIPVKLASLSALIAKGNGNVADTLSIRIVDEARRPDSIDLPIDAVPLGMTSGEFRFRKPLKMLPGAVLEALWQNEVANTKTLTIAAAFVRDFGSPLDTSEG